ncbi:MAG: hypothetical protein ABI192_20685 [Bradyrhizobium sp.]
MEKQDILARLREHEADLKAPDVVKPEEEADLDASLAEVARGEFAIDEAVHGKGARVPFMITQAQKEALRNKGFDDDQISNMTPAKAHDLLGVK